VRVFVCSRAWSIVFDIEIFRQSLFSFHCFLLGLQSRDLALQVVKAGPHRLCGSTTGNGFPWSTIMSSIV
jgi:hypothetical protein